MSKAALRQLSTFLKEKDEKKEYRNKTINSLVHGIDLGANSISKEIELEVLKTDPELHKLLDPSDYKKASSIMRAHIMGRVNNEKSSLRLSPTNKNMAIANSFGTVSTVLKEASDKILQYFTSVLNAKGSDYAFMAGTKGKLVNLDHIRTVGETKLGRDIYRVSGLDPVRLISALKAKSYVTKTKSTEVFDNVLEIISYYKGNQKVFEISGSVVPDDKNPITGKIASSYVNQQEGADIIRKRVATFKEAIEAAIKDVKWDDQQASDSYRDYVMKSLNNAAVKAGAQGKIQSINTAANKVKNSSRRVVKTDVTIKTVKPQAGLKNKPAPKQQAMFSLQAINDFINSRLPEVVKANMGPGSLVNRTGRFASSARAVATVKTAQGFPSIGYTYQRSPYDVFDKTLGKAPWNTPGRDPKALIEKSIREIVQEMAIGRFYMRRV